MKILIVEDDFASRKILVVNMAPHGQCDQAVNGKEAVEAFEAALNEGEPYDLVFMDIMLPIMDGQQALLRIRELEKEHHVKSTDEVKVIMTTALDDPKNVVQAYYKGGATSYLPKPIDKHLLLQTLRNIGLVD